MANEGFGTGQGGKSFQDRKLAAEVRTITLTRSKEVLLKKKPRVLYETLLVKLAGTALPRLNEHTGADGEDLFPVPIYNGKSTKRKGV